MLKILLFFVLIVSNSEQVRYRIYKINCSSSNLTCINNECRLKSTSRTNQTLSIGATLLKNLSSPLFRIEWSSKTSNNQWREIFKLEKVPVCLFFNRSIRLPYAENMVDAYVKAFPQFPSACPILAGEYYMRNIPNGDYDVLKDTFLSNFGGIPGNGEYKIEYKIFSTRDDNIFSITVKAEVDTNGSG